MEIDRSNVVDYLTSHSLLRGQDVRQVETLGWGVSNTLIKVVTSTSCFVVKQSLSKLRVEAEWSADRDRVYHEKDCIDTWRRLLGDGTVPEILHEDRQNYLFIMSCAPRDGRVWKENLLSGQVNLDVARQVGVILGQVHERSHDKEEIRQRFLDDHVFIQLRVDPYYWTTAKVHPDVAKILREEADHMLSVKTTLVHGDYSPKNVIVYGQPERVFVLDFEVAHFGNPAFDIGFCLSHLFLKSMHRPQNHEEYFHAADTFWHGYCSKVGFLDHRVLENDIVKQLGCLMLARIDGKSPVEYIKAEDVKAAVRSLAKKLILGNHLGLPDAKDLVREELTRIQKVY